MSTQRIPLFLICLFLALFPHTHASQKVSQNPTHKPFIIVSPPKNGTHLVGKALELITNKAGTYHLVQINDHNDALQLILNDTEKHSFSVIHKVPKKTLKVLVQKGYKIIFIVRDPRDQLISLQNWLREGQWPWIKATRIKDENAQLEEIITGKINGWRGFKSCFLNYEALLKKLPKEAVYKTRFEKLVGPQGQGSKADQIEEIIQLAQFLEIDFSIAQAETVAQQIYGNTWTFRSGQIGNWKNHFTAHHKTIFKILYNDHLIRLGYETNDKW